MCFGSKKKSSRRAYTEAGFKTEDNLLPISNVHYKHPSPGLSSTRMGSHPIFKGWPRGRVGGSTRPPPPCEECPQCWRRDFGHFGDTLAFSSARSADFFALKIDPQNWVPRASTPRGRGPLGVTIPCGGRFCGGWHAFHRTLVCPQGPQGSCGGYVYLHLPMLHLPTTEVH